MQSGKGEIMSNSIDAHVEFSFKGETHALSATLDLDKLIELHGAVPSVHAILADGHGIDTRSYLYEVMLEEEIRFDNPQGLAANYLKDGVFDLDRYTQDAGAQRLLALLQSVASREMGVTDLEQQPQLKRALLHAYQLGVEA
jgi:hypothetical protein